MTFATEVLADSPVGFWLLDETSGTTASDSSGNGHHGSYVNTPTLAADTLGTLTAPTFDAASNEHVTLPAISLGAPGAAFTVEAVGRLTDTSANVTRALLHQMYNGSVIGAAIGTRIGQVGVAQGINGGGYNSLAWRTVASGVTWTAGDIHHVAYTFDGTTGTIYVDGTARATHAPTGYSVPSYAWKIGSDHGVNEFIGAIAGVAMYSTCLSATRIDVHYDALAIGLIEGAVSFTATATLTATADPGPVAAVSLTAEATLEATGVGIVSGAVSFGPAATLSAAGTEIVSAQVSFGSTATVGFIGQVGVTSIRLGAAVVDAVYLGGSAVTAAYVGTDLIYSGGAP